MHREWYERPSPHVNIGTIGHCEAETLVDEWGDVLVPIEKSNLRRPKPLLKKEPES